MFLLRRLHGSWLRVLQQLLAGRDEQASAGAGTEDPAPAFVCSAQDPRATGKSAGGNAGRVACPPTCREVLVRRAPAQSR